MRDSAQLSAAAGVLELRGVLAAGTGFWACVGGAAHGLVGGVLGEGVVVEVDDAVVAVKVMESGHEALLQEVGEVDGEDAEAEELDAGDAGDAFWVLWARRVRVWVPASGVCTRFPWCPVCCRYRCCGLRDVWPFLVFRSCLRCAG